MNDFSILIGGKAGDGVNQAGLMMARLLNQLGYRIYIYYDYPSLIRGGHNFSIIRASKDKIATHLDKIDCLLALSQDCLDLHQHRLKDNTLVIYDSDKVKSNGLGIPLTQIVKEAQASDIMRNTCLLGAFCKAMDIKPEVLNNVFNKHIKKYTDLNLKIAQRGYESSRTLTTIQHLDQSPWPILTGNEAVALGLIKGGLRAYIAYPMTPASSILHYLAKVADQFGLKVIHPENEIAVMLMAVGFAYAGQKVAVGTSGGGFCLMTEGLSLSGMAEIPMVVIVSQRPGPSTGVPTYTAQADLSFVLNAGQGEFVRFIIAPGDAEEAYVWSSIALNISWKYQIPSLILLDKTLSEGSFNVDIDSLEDIEEAKSVLWNGQQSYKRYLNTDTGVSPLAFASDKEAVIKVNSYEHDEFGITTEDPGIITEMQEKRLRKASNLSKELEDYEVIKTYGDGNASTALLCWGSPKGVCAEVAMILGLKVIQPLVLSPFPVNQFRQSINNVKQLIAVENNATGQLVRLINQYGFQVDHQILKYDGRPFTLDELKKQLEQVL